MPDNKRNTEQRTMLTRAAEFQTREDGDDLIIEGYFATFEGEYVMGDWGVERSIRTPSMRPCATTCGRSSTTTRRWCSGAHPRGRWSCPSTATGYTAA